MLRTCRQLWQTYGSRSLTFCLVALITFAISLHLPLAVKALDWRDLLRIIPSAIQIIQLSNLSDADEVALGQSIDRQIKTQVRISHNSRANKLVQDLGQLLVRSSDRPDIPYTFQVVEDRSLNAFATMGASSMYIRAPSPPPTTSPS